MSERSPVMEGAVAYQDILVFLDASPDTEARLGLAVTLARAHKARLFGVDVTPRSVLKGAGATRP